MRRIAAIMRLIPRSVLIALTATALVPASAAAQAPAPLTGEHLQAISYPLPPGADEPGDIVVTQRACAADGSGSVSFTATGHAVGPYPGTFEETVTATWGPSFLAPPPPGGPTNLHSVEASFSIDSPLGQVIGKKVFDPTAEPLYTQAGECFDFAESGSGSATNVNEAPVCYLATITNASGTFADRGRAPVNFSSTYVGNPQGEPPPESQLSRTFYEDFVSDPTALCAGPLPTNAEQCKKGGWRQYGVFKNQGDCVSYVRTGGKNPPAGP